MDGWMDGRMEGWKDGRMDGWMGTYTYILAVILSHRPTYIQDTYNSNT